MAIKYVCDVCGKEHPLPAEEQAYPGQQYQNLSGWAVISIVLPKAVKPQNEVQFVAYAPPISYLVCSQVCVDKALDEARGALKIAFRKAG